MTSCDLCGPIRGKCLGLNRHDIMWPLWSNQREVFRAQSTWHHVTLWSNQREVFRAQSRLYPFRLNAVLLAVTTVSTGHKQSLLIKCVIARAVWTERCPHEHVLHLEPFGTSCVLTVSVLNISLIRCHFEYELWSVNLRVGLRVWTQRGSGVLLPFICFELCGETVWKQSGLPDLMRLAWVLLHHHIKSNGK